MLKIKVCGLTDPANVKEITRADIDFAGFIFYPGSKRFVGNEPDMNLFRIIPVHVKKVGVFVDEDPEKILKIAQKAALDIIQLHGDENTDYCRKIKSYGRKVIKAFRIGSGIDMKLVNEFTEVCNYFLFDSGGLTYGGSGLKFDWNILGDIKPGRPFFLSGGITPEDVSELKKIDNKMFFGVDINSRFEISHGIKDPGKVKKFAEDIKNK